MKNQASIIGHLGDNPVIRRTHDGRAIANFSVATTEKWKTRDGEKREETTWHKVVCFNEGTVTNYIEKFFQKGSLVSVDGAIKHNDWTDNEGVKRRSTEIHVSAFKGEVKLLSGGKGGDRDRGDRRDERDDSSTRGSGGGGSGYDAGEPYDDSIPFAASVL